MPTWPAGLPQAPLLSSYDATPVDHVIRSQVDVGPNKLRRRYTGRMSDLNLSMLMTAAQVTILETFFYDTIKAGSLAFDFPDPISGATVSVRLKSPYQVTTDQTSYTVSLELEVLPS